MASFRRSLSMPTPKLGDSSSNEEARATTATSPTLSKSSFSNNSDHHPLSLFPRSFSSLDYTLCKVQALVLRFFPKRSLKSKGHVWRRAIFNLLVWFLLGVFIGFTPFASPDFPINFLAKNQAFSFEKQQKVDTTQNNHASKNMGSETKDIDQYPNFTNPGLILANPLIISNQSSLIDQDPISFSSVSTFNKLLIIVTPIYGHSFEAYYINRLANTLRLVPPPLLWIIVEMGSQSLDIAELLRNSGVMFRHLVGKESLVEVMNTIDSGMHLRNLALSHIEEHKINGIILFANYDNIYTLDLFDQMRQIRRFGTWAIAKVEKEERNDIMMEGPVCNGSTVIGWHSNDMTNRFKRFHVRVSGFAFNSTILWDPKRWRKPTLKPIRFLHTVKEVFQVSTFIGQIVEDESQMEGFPVDCSRIMVWHFNMESVYSFRPRKTSLLPTLPDWFNGMKNLPL